MLTSSVLQFFESFSSSSLDFNEDDFETDKYTVFFALRLPHQIL